MWVDSCIDIDKDWLSPVKGCMYAAPSEIQNQYRYNILLGILANIF